ncbi:MAG: hypothetical protein RL150_664, partial [Candidatus Parcubacteria bacterium]
LVFLKPSGQPSGDVLTVGFVGPLSGDGAAWGEIERNTIALAIDEINANGGVAGMRLEAIYEDGKCEGPTALSAAQKLVEIDGVKIIFVSCSQEIIPLAPYAEENGVILWASYAAASNISDLGPLVFRNAWTNRDMSKAMAVEAEKIGETAVIISEESAFASDLRDLFIAQFEERGGSVVANENYAQGGRDFRAQVAKIVALNPSVVVVNPNGPESGIAILRQLRQLGYEGPFVGNFFGGSAQVQALPEAQGMVYVSDPVFTESPLKRRVFAAYEEMYGGAPDLPWPVGARYDAVYLLKEAVEAVGTNPVDIAAYLHNMPKDFTGILGTYRFEKDTPDITNVRPSVARIQDGTSVSITE